MMTFNPIVRPEISKLMRHDWFKKYLKKDDLKETDQTFLKKTLTNMQKFQVFSHLFQDTKSNNLQGAVFVFIVNFVKGPEDEA